MDKRYLCMMVMLVTALAHAASIHKWVDEHGQVHYEDRPPPGGAKHMQVQTVPAPGVPAQYRTEQANRDLEERFNRAIREHQIARDSSVPDVSRSSVASPSTCAYQRRRLEDIQDRLRRGYSVDEGNYLHRWAERLQEDISAECR